MPNCHPFFVWAKIQSSAAAGRGTVSYWLCLRLQVSRSGFQTLPWHRIASLDKKLCTSPCLSLLRCIIGYWPNTAREMGLTLWWMNLLSRGGAEILQLLLAIALIFKIRSCHLGQWLMCDFSFHLFLKEQCHKDMEIFSKIYAAIHLFIHTLFSRLFTIKSRTVKG